MTAGRRHVRAATIWLALAVALLSSLLPGGLPRTTIHGSAFNPATTAVVLQPSRTQPRVLAEAARKDDNPASGASAAIAATRVALAMPAADQRALSQRVRNPDFSPSPFKRLSNHPRGPPAA